MSAGQAAVAALQAALAAENAAVYGYGVAGAHLAGRAFSRAQRDWDAHQAARDVLAGMIAARGAAPAAAAASYRLPFSVGDAKAAAGLAAYLEEQATSAYLGVVAIPDPALRAFGARSAAAAALRAAAWRRRTVAFPGLPGGRPPAPPQAGRAGARA